MLHPRLTPIGGVMGGPSSLWMHQIGPYGSWGDLNIITRWGEGMSGMYEAQWTMPLPQGFDHPILRRGTLVELMDGPLRLGSPLILSEPARGTGLDNPWQLVATGIGREVEGSDSFYAFDGSGNTTASPATAVDAAIIRGWMIAGRTSAVPIPPIGGSGTTDDLMTVGSLLNATSDNTGQRHYVDRDNLLTFAADPTTPTYQVTPGTPGFGTADNNYACTVYVRYQDAADLAYKTVTAQDARAIATQGLFGRKEYAANLTDRGPVTGTVAQGWADNILDQAKGRLAWTNGITVTSNEIQTMGGVRADLLKVLEDVGTGCKVRMNGIWPDLLAFNGETYLDVVIGEAKFTDGGQAIDLSPLGLAPRDLASIIEDIAGPEAA